MRSLLLISILVMMATTAAAGVSEFALMVHSFNPGVEDLGSVDLISNQPCRGSGRMLDLTDVLDPPNDKFVTLGDGGAITLSFLSPIQDLPGSDLRVWVSCNIVCEPGDVSVSQDGIDFYPVGGLQSWPFVDYDLAVVGLPFVTLVRVQDRLGGPCPGLGLAVDLDAVESLHPGPPIALSQRTWSAVRHLYR